MSYEFLSGPIGSLPERLGDHLIPGPLAHLRHANWLWRCPLTGADRKSTVTGQTDANDPTQTYLVSCLTE
jgi:hypothetical protein